MNGFTYMNGRQQSNNQNQLMGQQLMTSASQLEPMGQSSSSQHQSDLISQSSSTSLSSTQASNQQQQIADAKLMMQHQNNKFSHDDGQSFIDQSPANQAAIINDLNNNMKQNKNNHNNIAQTSSYSIGMVPSDGASLSQQLINSGDTFEGDNKFVGNGQTPTTTSFTDLKVQRDGIQQQQLHQLFSQQHNSIPPVTRNQKQQFTSGNSNLGELTTNNGQQSLQAQQQQQQMGASVATPTMAKASLLDRFWSIVGRNKNLLPFANRQQLAPAAPTTAMQQSTNQQHQQPQQQQYQQLQHLTNSSLQIK